MAFLGGVQRTIVLLQGRRDRGGGRKTVATFLFGRYRGLDIGRAMRELVGRDERKRDGRERALGGSGCDGMDALAGHGL